MLLVLVMVLSTFAACGKKEEETNADTTKTVEENKETEKEEPTKAPKEE